MFGVPLNSSVMSQFLFRFNYLILLLSIITFDNMNFNVAFSEVNYIYCMCDYLLLGTHIRFNLDFLFDETYYKVLVCFSFF